MKFISPRSARTVRLVLAMAVSLLAAAPASGQTQTAAEGWSGWARCQLTAQAPGYINQQVHTWIVTGPPTLEGDFRLYPTTWTVTGKGSNQRDQGAGRTVTEQWTTSGPPMRKRIAVSLRASDGMLRIFNRDALLRSNNATAGTSVAHVTNGNVADRTTQIAYYVDEWPFPVIQDVATNTDISGSTTAPITSSVAPGQPPGTMSTSVCSWKFVRGATTPVLPPGDSSTPVTSTTATPPPTTATPTQEPTLIAVPAGVLSTVAAAPTPVAADPAPAPAPRDRTPQLTVDPSLLQPPLWGWADLHTHPMSNLAFGGKLFHGAPDVGSLMPAVQMPYDPECRFDVRAKNIDEALSDDAPTHGDPIQSRCGNVFRSLLIKVLEEENHAVVQAGHAVGSPSFTNWPKWDDITHQKMWFDWIKRARDGGLRVMVMLSHNNRTIGEAVAAGGPGGPISGFKDDMRSSDLQIAEITAFVGRHSDFMEVAKTSADLYRIVQANKVAIILGVEIDNIGDFNDKPGLTAAMIDAEIARLYAQGVRYIFPVHLADNSFGDTAIYEVLFNVANYRETGKFWTVVCARPEDKINFQSLDFPSILNPFIPPGAPQPPRAPACANGHINGRTADGLTTLGQFAIKAMMKRGMIIDIDHMSNMTAEKTLQLAWDVMGGGYPLMSGHSAVRDGGEFGKENSRTPAQLEKIACLGGMFGVGTAGVEAYDWANEYVLAFNAMSHAFASDGKCPDRAVLGAGMVAFGTDTNSLVSTPRPTMVNFKTAPRFTDIYNASSPANDNPRLPVQPKSISGVRTWDYNTDGVAHYGMFADFVKDVRTAPARQGMNGKDLVDKQLLSNADYFFRMWQKAERQATNVR